MCWFVFCNKRLWMFYGEMKMTLKVQLVLQKKKKLLTCLTQSTIFIEDNCYIKIAYLSMEKNSIETDYILIDFHQKFQKNVYID